MYEVRKDKQGIPSIFLKSFNVKIANFVENITAKDILQMTEILKATSDRTAIEDDIKFLEEMHDITQHLMTKQYDICRLELLNKMIEDWKDELESRADL